ncbi:MAG: phage tail protein [Nostoc sp.]|uniref:phage tail protein n=1 Tax=Nostoc sp. TaxID=1180 RepID=UPI002FF97029
MLKQPEFLTSCRFYLELKLDGSIDSADGYFMECQGFKRTQEVIPISEVTPQVWSKAKTGRIVSTHIPGNLKSSNLVLRRGMTSSMTLWNWLKAVEEGNWAQQRRDGILTIYNQAAEAQATFEFKGAWPTSYTITDVKASANELEIEEIELIVEEFKRTNVSK